MTDSRQELSGSAEVTCGRARRQGLHWGTMARGGQRIGGQSPTTHPTPNMEKGSLSCSCLLQENVFNSNDSTLWQKPPQPNPSSLFTYEEKPLLTSQHLSQNALGTASAPPVIIGVYRHLGSNSSRSCCPTEVKLL